jgi:4-oxalocrotonate tautomerase
MRKCGKIEESSWYFSLPCIHAYTRLLGPISIKRLREVCMPIIQVNLMEGRSVDQKRKLVSEITDAVVKSLDVPPDAVRVILQDMSKENYAIAGKLQIDK